MRAKAESERAPAPQEFRLLRGALLELRPLPMAAALLIVLLGALWARAALVPAPPFLPWVLLAVFFGLLAAHLMDSLVDVVKRGDRTPADYPLLFRDSTGVLRDRDYVPLLAAAAVASGLSTIPVAWTAGAVPAFILLCALALALAYAPALDRTMAGVSLGYPAGACAVFLASVIAAGGTPDTKVAWMTVALFAALVGTKVRADVIDLEDDRKAGKRTVAAAFGARAATVGGYALAIGGLLAAAGAPAVFPLPTLFALPPIGAAAAFAFTSRMEPLPASMWMAYALLATLGLEVAILSLSGP